MPAPGEREKGPRRGSPLDFRSGGWVILLAILISTILVGSRVALVLRSRGERAIGDGKDPVSYGFDLSHCLVERNQIVGGGISKDGLAALDRPRLLTAAQVDSVNEARRGNILVSDDRVIGVTIGGRSRAYPVRILNWHEVVNDTLAGRPIAVTYHPLCDAVVVFDREIGGEIREFRVSGLLYNSNALYYDRQADRRMESLWSQVGMCAVAGPAAESRWRFEPMPAAVMPWGEWRRRHPETAVIAPLEEMADAYKRNPYGVYFGSDLLRFPVRPLPPPSIELPLKEPMIVVGSHRDRRAYPFSIIARRAGDGGAWETTNAGRAIVFRLRREPLSVDVEALDGGPAPPVVYALWFSWYAIHPDPRIVEGTPL